MKKFESELDIEESACSLVWKNLGIGNNKLKAVGEDGFPDRVFWIPGGKPLLIEFKKPGEQPTEKQSSIHENLTSLGYNVQVHDDEFNAFEAIITAVEATQLSKESRKILIRACIRCAILRSRARKDIDNTSGH